MGTMMGCRAVGKGMLRGKEGGEFTFFTLLSF